MPSVQSSPGVANLQRVADRVKKLHARALGGGSSEFEMAEATKIMVRMLDTHRPALRYCYPSGVVLRILPARALNTSQAQRMLCSTRAHRGGAFKENQRVTDPSVSTKAVARGYLAFQRYGYYIFVPISALDIRV